VRVSVGLSARPPHRLRLVPEFEARVPSASDPGLFYTVTLLSDGTWECDCPGWRYAARDDGLCKHVDQVRQEYEYLCSLAAIL
jgi:hypothetical protein